MRSPDDISRFVPWLHYRDGELSIIGGPVLDDHLADDNPSIVYSVPHALSRFGELRSAFRRHFDRVHIAYALKACYVRPVVRALVDAGAGLEVMSGLELAIARRAGCPGEAVVSNGVGMRPDHVRGVVEAGALVVVDNVGDLRRVDAAARAVGRRVRLGLRVTPDVGGDRFVGSSAKLGCDWAGGGFLALVDEAKRATHCDLVALHAHQLTHAHDLDRYTAAVRGLADVARAVLAERGIRFETVDIGGGFDTGYLLAARGLAISDFADAAAKELAAIGYPFELVVEPGRFLVADAAVGLTSVTGEKQNGDRRWRVTDLGSNVLIPLPELAYHPVPLRWPSGGTWSRYDVGDGTCAPTVLCRDARLPDGREGLRLGVLNVGAYTTVFAESWAFPLPDIAVWDGNQLSHLVGSAERAAMFTALHGVDPFAEPA
ncbi:diaminopimelate decarboxylase family protein [Actinokineospora alba]|uniref:diaminopimelate decarboxylase family protein n=1 Tax=Actinokineospora alba TaxID=504798 RepID=UPI001414EBE3|nr:alanine racemase [Actinokineospora alba]